MKRDVRRDCIDNTDEMGATRAHKGRAERVEMGPFGKDSEGARDKRVNDVRDNGRPFEKGMNFESPGEMDNLVAGPKNDRARITFGARLIVTG